MKIALLFDGMSALGKSADLLILETVEAIEKSLVVEGNEVVRIPVALDGRWVERVRRGKFDLAFNLCECIDGIAEYESAVISVLEVLGIPFTGSSSWTTAFCLRKHIVNALLERAGLPVPRWAIVTPGSTLPTVGFPAICKPAAEDASVGVEQRSVVRNMRTLAARVDAMHERWNEILVQRFIDGREVNVGIVDDVVLPIAEIQFGAMPKGMWRIVSYRSKWETGSDEDMGATPVCPANLSAAQSAELKRLARDAWRAVGGEGYGRVDMRIDSQGRPWILEVNANPDIAPDAGLARMAAAEGMDYPALISAVCEAGMRRRRAQEENRWALSAKLSGVVIPGDPDSLELFAAGVR
jgi:D-alanine-D-alanine ligase